MTPTPIPDISPPTCNDYHPCYRSPDVPVMYPYHRSGYSSGVGVQPRHDSGDSEFSDLSVIVCLSTGVIIGSFGTLICGLGKLWSVRNPGRSSRKKDAETLKKEKLAWSIAVTSPQEPEYAQVITRIDRYLNQYSSLTEAFPHTQQQRNELWTKTIGRILRALLDDGIKLTTTDRLILTRIENGDRSINILDLAFLDARPSSHTYEFHWQKKAAE